MIELMVALTLFSVGMLGLLSAQLSGQRSIQASLDRSLATSLAADLLARIELNAGEVAIYASQTLQRADGPPSSPPVDCYRIPCTPTDLALYDWWDWTRQIMSSTNSVLPEAHVCITHAQDMATVNISWRGKTQLLPDSAEVCEEVTAEEAVWRRHVQLSTFTGAI